jgi:hypothetical protein
LAIDTDTGSAPATDVTAEDGSSISDGRSGYYIAGHDWPAIFNTIDIADIYAALREIDDEQVAAAGKTLLDAAPPTQTDGTRRDP